MTAPKLLPKLNSEGLTLSEWTAAANADTSFHAGPGFDRLMAAICQDEWLAGVDPCEWRGQMDRLRAKIRGKVT